MSDIEAKNAWTGWAAVNLKEGGNFPALVMGSAGTTCPKGIQFALQIKDYKGYWINVFKIREGDDWRLSYMRAEAPIVEPAPQTRIDEPKDWEQATPTFKARKNVKTDSEKIEEILQIAKRNRRDAFIIYIFAAAVFCGAIARIIYLKSV